MIKTNILHSIGGKKAWSALLVVLPLCLFLASCVDEDEYADNPKGNLEALWHIMDEHYCFFGEKNIDWNAIYEKYRVRVDDGMTELQLFEVLSSMLGELRDGHVNLYTSFDYGRNWSWHEDYPSNFSDTLQRRYLGTDYKIATGMRYRILDDNVGYIYLGSFSGTITYDEAYNGMTGDGWIYVNGNGLDYDKQKVEIFMEGGLCKQILLYDEGSDSPAISIDYTYEWVSK